MNQKSNALTTRPPLFSSGTILLETDVRISGERITQLLPDFFYLRLSVKQEKFRFLFQRGTANNVELESKRMKKTLFVPTVGLEPTTLRLKV